MAHDEGSERSDDVALTKAERGQVRRRGRPRAAVLYETIRREGDLELHRRFSALAWSGLAAGLSMGFSFLGMALIAAHLPDARWRPLLASFGYCIGFVVVIMGRQQLFTENTLTPVLTLLKNPRFYTLWLVVRLWAIVLLANLFGALLFATLIAKTDVFGSDAGKEFERLGAAALDGSFGTHFLRGVFSGWLIALIVWLLPGAGAARAFIIVLLSYLIGLGGLLHVIAGSVETLYCVALGTASWSQYGARFLAPVLLGNIVGGVALVAAVSHAQVAAEPRKGDLDDGTPIHH